MGSREVEFEADGCCDICGQRGAFDFYGDYYCGQCTKGLVNHDGTPVEDREGER